MDFCLSKGIMDNFFLTFICFYCFQSLLNVHVLFSQWEKVRCFKEEELYSIMPENPSELLGLSAKPRASVFV